MSNETDEKSCPFCAERILAAARKCKHCGEFLDGEARQQAQAQKSAQLIEQTGKEWKIASALGALLIVLCPFAWASVSGELAMPIFGLGCLLYFGGKAGAWWNHG
jgi:hypothetical protein